jgi:hypothetical protein
LEVHHLAHTQLSQAPEQLGHGEVVRVHSSGGSHFLKDMECFGEEINFILEPMSSQSFDQIFLFLQRGDSLVELSDGHESIDVAMDELVHGD